MYRAEIDPALERQLETAKADEPVEAVLVLKDDVPHQAPIDVEALIRRVRACDPNDDIETNYLPRIGVLIVRASSRMVRLLISQPEIELASPNRTAGDLEL